MLEKDRQDYLLNFFDAEKIDTKPNTENELLELYNDYGENLYMYVQENINVFIRPLSNELRAMLGHLSCYRVHNERGLKTELDKAYGHFRRFCIDALKILCDEFDRSAYKELSRNLEYDFRDYSASFLKEFSARYFKAHRLYIEAQKEERVGSDYGVHNLIKMYYIAAAEYINLKQFYDSQKKDIQTIRNKIYFKRIIAGLVTSLGIISGILDIIIP